MGILAHILTIFLHEYVHFWKIQVLGQIFHIEQATTWTNNMERRNSFHATKKDLVLLIESLDRTKVHACENISLTIIETCNDSITKPLKTFSNELSKNGVFWEIWKRENVAPAHKKEEKCLLKKYCLSVYFIFLRKSFKQ